MADVKLVKPRRGASGEDQEMVNAANKAAQELMDPWKDRNSQWVKDRQQLTMSYKARVNPYELIMTNDIPVQHAFATAILAGKEPRFRLPIGGAEDGNQRNQMNKSERLIDAVWREMDKGHRRQGNGGLLHDIMFYADLGGICVFPRLGGKPSTPTFHLTVYDPINCYPEYGELGLLRWVRVYSTTTSDAFAIAASQGWNTDKIDLKKDTTQVVNLWNTEWDDKGKVSVFNTVIMSGEVMKPKTDHTKTFGESIPVQMIGVNGIPTSPYTDPFMQANDNVGVNVRGSTKDWGRPVFYMNRELAKALDRNYTYSAEISRRHAIPHYAYYSDEGMQTMTPKEFEETMVHNFRGDERFEMITPATSPRERETIIQGLEGKMAQGALSRLVMGILDSNEISGVALERAITQSRSILQPYVMAGEHVISDSMMSLLGQMKRRNVKVTLESRSSTLGPELGYVREDYTASEDIPDVSNVQVTLPMNLPDNTLLKLDMARIAIPGPEPILPQRYAREEIIGVQDEANMEKLLEEDRVKLSPAVQSAKQMAGLRRVIADMQASPNIYTEEEVEEVQLALLSMREQYKQLVAPATQQGQNQVSNRQPSPQSSPPEDRNRGSSNLEAEADISSTIPRNGTSTNVGQQLRDRLTQQRP